MSSLVVRPIPVFEGAEMRSAHVTTRKCRGW